MNIILDTLYLRRPRIEYVSPPICPIQCPLASASGSSMSISISNPIPMPVPPGAIQIYGGPILTVPKKDALGFSVYKTPCGDPSGTLTLVADGLSFDELSLCKAGYYKVSIVTDTEEGALSDAVYCDGVNRAILPLPAADSGNYRVYYSADNTTFSALMFWPVTSGAYQFCDLACYEITYLTFSGESPPSPVNCACLTFADPPADGCLSVPYSSAISVENGTGPYFWELIGGTPPTGLTVHVGGTDDPTLLIDGTPIATGRFSFTVKVTDIEGLYSSQTFEIDVVESRPDSPLLPAQLGQDYNQALTAEGGQPPASFALAAGQMPPGLTLNSDGTITGVPLTAGTFTFLVEVTTP